MPGLGERRGYDVGNVIHVHDWLWDVSVELDGFFGANQGDPLQGTNGTVDTRLKIVRERRGAPLGAWHRHMMRLATELIDAG